MNYIFVSTDLDLPTNQASEDSKRQVTQSRAERQETNACLALPRTLAEQGETQGPGERTSETERGGCQPHSKAKFC